MFSFPDNRRERLIIYGNNRMHQHVLRNIWEAQRKGSIGFCSSGLTLQFQPSEWIRSWLSTLLFLRASLPHMSFFFPQLPGILSSPLNALTYWVFMQVTII